MAEKIEVDGEDAKRINRLLNQVKNTLNNIEKLEAKQQKIYDEINKLVGRVEGKKEVINEEDKMLKDKYDVPEGFELDLDKEVYTRKQEVDSLNMD